MQSIHVPLLQDTNGKFNRAKLMNIGFTEAQKHGAFDCFVFHDVDLLPVVTGIPYSCSHFGPLHLVPAMDKFDWR
jgi:beta-1,4-galactosyltransferase 1